MAKIETFRDLIAWQKARELIKPIYQWTRQLPEEERFVLVPQMRRAVWSISSNIAEGFGTGTRPGFLRQLRIARGSGFELQSQLENGAELHGVAVDAVLKQLIDRADRVLQALINSLERTTAPPPAPRRNGRQLAR